MSPFGGFDMPIQYTSIIEEHNAVRHACGIFDVSHMGEVLISGPDAERLVGHLFTNDVREMPVGKVLYGMMLYPEGGVVDDLLVYKTAPDAFFLVINAANMVRCGVGTALCFDLDMAFDGLRFLPLSPEIETGPVLVWKKDQALTPAVEAFHQHIKNV